MFFPGIQAPLLGPGFHLTFPGWSLLPRTVFLQSHSSSHCPGGLPWSALGCTELKVRFPPAPDCLPPQPSLGPYSSLPNELYRAGLVWFSGSFPSRTFGHWGDLGDGHRNGSCPYSRTRSLGGKPGFLDSFHELSWTRGPQRAQN